MICTRRLCEYDTAVLIVAGSTKIVGYDLLLEQQWLSVLTYQIKHKRYIQQVKLKVANGPLLMLCRPAVVCFFSAYCCVCQVRIVGK